MAIASVDRALGLGWKWFRVEELQIYTIVPHIGLNEICHRMPNMHGDLSRHAMRIDSKQTTASFLS